MPGKKKAMTPKARQHDILDPSNILTGPRARTPSVRALSAESDLGVTRKSKPPKASIPVALENIMEVSELSDVPVTSALSLKRTRAEEDKEYALSISGESERDPDELSLHQTSSDAMEINLTAPPIKCPQVAQSKGKGKVVAPVFRSKCRFISHVQ